MSGPCTALGGRFIDNDMCTERSDGMCREIVCGTVEALICGYGGVGRTRVEKIVGQIGLCEKITPALQGKTGIQRVKTRVEMVPPRSNYAFCSIDTLIVGRDKFNNDFCNISEISIDCGRCFII